MFEISGKVCRNCGIEIPREKKWCKVFCSHSCSAKFNNRGKTRNARKRFCVVCGAYPLPGFRYCSKECVQIAREERVKVRDYLLEQFLENHLVRMSEKIRWFYLRRAENTCQQCGWNLKNQTFGVSPIEIHHKDGNRYNNSRKNILVLCPNCHSLTWNFRRKQIS